MHAAPKGWAFKVRVHARKRVRHKIHLRKSEAKISLAVGQGEDMRSVLAIFDL